MPDSNEVETALVYVNAVPPLKSLSAAHDPDAAPPESILMGAPTLRVNEVVAVVPEVPVTVIVKAPVVAVLLAVSVSTLEVADDVGLNTAVTPLGMPDAVNATLPVNPPTSVTVMVSVPLLP